MSHTSSRGMQLKSQANFAAKQQRIKSPGETDARLAQLRAKQTRRWRLSLLVGLLDAISIATAYVVASLLYLNAVSVEQISRTLLSLLPIVLLLNLNNRAYAIDVVLEPVRSIWRGSSGLIWASLIMFLLFFFLKISEEFSRVILALGTMLSVGLITLSRLSCADLARRLFGGSPFANLCIYDGVEPSDGRVDSVVLAQDIGLEPTRDNPEMQDRLGTLALGVDCVVVHCQPERREAWAFMLKSLDVATEIVVPELTKLQPLAIMSRSGQASLRLGSGQLSWSQRAMKRAFDLSVTLAVMPLLGPILLLVAIAIKLDSKGPVLFRQNRIGLGNRKFQILKFRTMRVEMLDHEARKTTSRSDPRVTRVGHFLRRTSIDELPQFLNVMLGDMSIVGPRPHTELTAVGDTLLWEIDAAYWHRHVVKPGITGLAQVRGHRGSLFEEQQLKERLNADLEYVESWSLANDLKIILRTASVLVHRNAF